MNSFATMGDEQSVCHAGSVDDDAILGDKSESGRNKAPQFKNNLSMDPD